MLEDLDVFEKYRNKGEKKERKKEFNKLSTMHRCIFFSNVTKTLEDTLNVNISFPMNTYNIGVNLWNSKFYGFEIASILFLRVIIPKPYEHMQ